MPRSSWDGFLKFSLISIPVRAYNAAAPDRGEVRFNQIHKDCGERIQYRKFCPVHGEVDKDQIVSGYQVKKGEYVEIDREEIAELRAEDDEAISIDAFMAPDTIDAVYYSGKTFYLVPDGPAGQKAYALLCKVMADQGVHAVAHMVLSGHEEPVLIRPAGKLLEMAVLYYQSQIKAPATFEGEVIEPKVSAQELKLASALVEESTVDEFDLSKLKDRYTERVTELIESKGAGKPLPKRKTAKAPQVINLMDALKKSLKEAHGKKGTAHAHRRKRTG
jgi:DNA end-binding protein Ku